MHFDHSGGLRTWVDEGATIVTHEMNKPYYEQAWAAPHTLNPDKLAQSKKTATFETFSGKHVLTDGKRTIEIYEIAGQRPQRRVRDDLSPEGKDPGRG